MISRLMDLSKHKFTTINPYSPRFSSTKFHNYMTLLDDILVEEKYSRVHDLLDLIYKLPASSQSWKDKFLTIDYKELENHWPQVHAIDEITSDPKYLEAYREKQRAEKNEEVSVVKHFGLKSKRDNQSPALTMIRKYSDVDQDDSIPQVLKNVQELHKFLFKNQAVFDVKIPPLEVFYPTNKVALPIHPRERNKLLKKKVASIRNVFKSLRPIAEDDLRQLYEFAIHRPSVSHKPEYNINDKFYKYMIKKHNHEKDNLAPVIRHYLRQKKLIPNDHNIRKLFREYVMKQFYQTSNSKNENIEEYRMSWMQNYFENETSILESAIPSTQLPKPSTT
ncbi:hypothetical protein G9P44_002486 [Scheffersomyces stipitis]|nr:hypothetical protein G9P44_002486 [Scheffersomyces stipitis]